MTYISSEMYMDIMNDGKGPDVFLDEETENKLMEVIGQAK